MVIMTPGTFPDTVFPDRYWIDDYWADYGSTPINRYGKRFVELAGHGSGVPDYVPESISSGRRTVITAGTAVQLASPLATCGIIIVAEFTNAGVICVGDSGVIATEATRVGIPLNPGDATIITIDNISKIYIDCTHDGDGITYTMVN